jgi:hypothetical protein
MQESEPESEGSDPDSGPSSPESFASWDPATSSWKTLQLSLLGDLDSSSPTWPTAGSMRNGVCYRQQEWEPRTSGDESLSWPTPHGMSKDGRSNGPSGNELGHAVNQSLRWPTPRTTGLDGGSNSRKAAKARGMWPTPRATDDRASGPGANDEALLRRAASGWGLNLSEAVQVRTRFPTPTVQDAENNGGPSQSKRNTPPLNAVAGGALNPTWVEWLMGFPLGWTDLER